MNTGSVLEDYEKMAAKCLRCSFCKFIPQVAIKSQEFSNSCPSIDRYNFHSYSGGGRLVMALALLTNRLEFSPDVLDIIYKCTACGACDISCKYLNRLEPLEVIQATREKAVAVHAGPLPAHQAYTERVRSTHNPYGEDHEKRFDWMPEGVKPSPNARLAYFVGCTSAYRRKEIAAATAKVLGAAGVEFAVLGEEEFCCGSPLLRVGDRAAFEELARHNIEALRKRGIKEVIMNCAGCYSIFKVEYPHVQKLGFRVTHTSEFFSRLLREGRLKLATPIPKTATYHDPCHLGRLSEPYKDWRGIQLTVLTFIKLAFPPKPFLRGNRGVYKAPREVMKQVQGLKLVEMERNQEYAYCCGAGGGVKAAFPDFALHAAGTRIKEVRKAGAELLVSACPFCSTNLQDAIRAEGAPIKFCDISELLAQALPKGGSA